jgi:hypothetical protein
VSSIIEVVKEIGNDSEAISLAIKEYGSVGVFIAQGEAILDEEIVHSMNYKK